MLRKKGVTQESLDKEWRRRAKCDKISVIIAIPLDVKKKRMFETIADSLKVNRQKQKPRKVIK